MYLYLLVAFVPEKSFDLSKSIWTMALLSKNESYFMLIIVFLVSDGF